MITRNGGKSKDAEKIGFDILEYPLVRGGEELVKYCEKEDDCRGRRPRRSFYDRPEPPGLPAALFATAFTFAAAILSA